MQEVCPLCGCAFIGGLYHNYKVTYITPNVFKVDNNDFKYYDELNLYTCSHGLGNTQSTLMLANVSTLVA